MTEYKYEGKNYNSNLSTKDITKLLRAEIKKIAPKTKWSITCKYNQINVTLMEAPFEVFADGNEYATNGHMPINQYYLNDMKLTPVALEIFTQIKAFITSYNFDDSDSMIDYFHCNFYDNYNIGKWDKPFKMIAK